MAKDRNNYEDQPNIIFCDANGMYSFKHHYFIKKRKYLTNSGKCLVDRSCEPVKPAWKKPGKTMSLTGFIESLYSYLDPGKGKLFRMLQDGHEHDYRTLEKKGGNCSMDENGNKVPGDTNIPRFFIDCTIADVLIVDEHTGEAKRPYLVTAVDYESRMPVCSKISLDEPASAEEILRELEKEET